MNLNLIKSNFLKYSRNMINLKLITLEQFEQIFKTEFANVIEILENLNQRISNFSIYIIVINWAYQTNELSAQIQNFNTEQFQIPSKNNIKVNKVSIHSINNLKGNKDISTVLQSECRSQCSTKDSLSRVNSKNLNNHFQEDEHVFQCVEQQGKKSEHDFNEFIENLSQNSSLKSDNDQASCVHPRSNVIEICQNKGLLCQENKKELKELQTNERERKINKLKNNQLNESKKEQNIKIDDNNHGKIRGVLIKDEIKINNFIQFCQSYADQLQENMVIPKKINKIRFPRKIYVNDWTCCFCFNFNFNTRNKCYKCSKLKSKQGIQVF